jgi:hypothetical protein
MNKHPLEKITRIIVFIGLAASLFSSGFGGMFEVSAGQVLTGPNLQQQVSLNAAVTNGKYNDMDKAWAYTGNWAVVQDGSAYNGQLHISHNLSDSATISINGTAFTLMYSSAYKRGSLNILVDGKRIAVLNQKTVATVYKVNWNSPKLTAGTHVVKFVHISGLTIDIDMISVSGSTTQQSATATPTRVNATATLKPTTVGSPTSIASSPTSSPIPLSQTPTITPIPGSETATESSTAIASPTTGSPTAIESATPETSPTVTGSPTPTLSPTPTTITSQSTTYYVNGLKGSDSNTGTQSLPWKTIQKAANTLKTGTTVFVAAGTYNERVSVPHPGITFQAQGLVNMQGFIITGSDTIISGFNIDNTPASGWDGYGIKADAANCTIQNNYITHGPIGGIFSSANAIGCKIINNKLNHNLRSGLDIMGNNNIVQGNEIWDTVQFADWAQGKNPPSGFQPDADGILFFGSGSVFTKNYIHDIPSSNPDGTATNSHTDCFQTWGQIPATNIVIDGNMCKNIQLQSANLDNLGSGFTFEHNSGSIIVRNNLIFADVCFFEHDTVNVSFLNNDCIINKSIPSSPYPAGYPVGVSLGVNNTGTIVKNNLFYNVRGAIFYSNTAGITQSNYYVASASDFDGTTDYHLISTSKAINVGAKLTNVPDDYDGKARPYGTGFDIGAYEYTGK